MTRDWTGVPSAAAASLFVARNGSTQLHGACRALPGVHKASVALLQEAAEVRACRGSQSRRWTRLASVNCASMCSQAVPAPLLSPCCTTDLHTTCCNHQVEFDASVVSTDALVECVEDAGFDGALMSVKHPEAAKQLEVGRGRLDWAVACNGLRYLFRVSLTRAPSCRCWPPSGCDCCG